MLRKVLLLRLVGAVWQGLMLVVVMLLPPLLLLLLLLLPPVIPAGCGVGLLRLSWHGLLQVGR